jgi:hypothetical protein
MRLDKEVQPEKVKRALPQLVAFVAGIQLNVISRARCFQADGFADDKGDSLSLGLTDALRCLGAAFLQVKNCVRRFVRQSSVFFRHRLAGQEHDFPG